MTKFLTVLALLGSQSVYANCEGYITTEQPISLENAVSKNELYLKITTGTENGCFVLAQVQLNSLAKRYSSDIKKEVGLKATVTYKYRKGMNRVEIVSNITDEIEFGLKAL